jgi:hypothetical protein
VTKNGDDFRLQDMALKTIDKYTQEGYWEILERNI